MNNYKKKLSIIIPVYNEKRTIEKLLKKINELKDINKEIIVVNDASNDGTKLILEENKFFYSLLINHKKNLGKGAAIQSAQKLVKGDVVLIQDADLEYDPRDYYKML